MCGLQVAASTVRASAAARRSRDENETRGAPSRIDARTLARDAQRLHSAPQGAGESLLLVDQVTLGQSDGPHGDDTRWSDAASVWAS